MTSSSTAYHKYAQGIASNQDNLALLGNLCWFSIHDQLIPIDTLEKQVADLGLSNSFLRTRIRPVDAFRKTAKTFQKRFSKTDMGIQASFLVRPAGQDRDTSHRHVIFERIRVEKGKKRRLLYTPVVEMVFYRGENKNGQYSNYKMEVTPKEASIQALSGREAEWLQHRLDSAQDTFKEFMTCLDGEAFRIFIRNYLNTELGGVCVKPSGGVYFVRQDKEPELKALKALALEHNNFFHTLPLVDMEEQRDMVIQAFEAEAIGEIERMSVEIADMLSGTRKVKAETVNDRLQSAMDLLEKADGLSTILDRKADRVHTQIDIFKQQLLTLNSRVV